MSIYHQSYRQPKPKSRRNRYGNWSIRENLFFAVMLTVLILATTAAFAGAIFWSTPTPTP